MSLAIGERRRGKEREKEKRRMSKVKNTSRYDVEIVKEKEKNR